MRALWEKFFTWQGVAIKFLLNELDAKHGNAFKANRFNKMLAPTFTTNFTAKVK